VTTFLRKMRSLLKRNVGAKGRLYRGIIYITKGLKEPLYCFNIYYLVLENIKQLHLVHSNETVKNDSF
jgi:hypothetical protein